MRLSVLLLLVAGCAQPSDLEAEHAFVRRTGPVVDTLEVGRVDSLRASVTADVIRGTLRWSLLAPGDSTAWSGVIEDSAGTQWSMADPARGTWRLVLEPDSAIGVATVALEAR
jgi:hypothetical protein